MKNNNDLEIIQLALKLLAMDVIALTSPTNKTLRNTGNFTDLINEYIDRAKKGLNPKYMEWKK